MRVFQKPVIALMVLVFALALTGCAFACADGDSDCADEGECVCFCQTLAPDTINPVVATASPVIADFLALPDHVTPRLVVVAIFQPPRL